MKKHIILIFLLLNPMLFLGCSNVTSADMQTLRGEYFDFAIQNRLDYVPFFEEGKVPSSSSEYLFYAFALNLENWGDNKGIMTRDYVEKVINTHFEVEKIIHNALRKAWDFDGEQYIAIPSSIREKPIYVLKEINTQTQNGRTVYEITLDYCNFGEGIPTEEDMLKVRASIISGDISDLKVLQTERFRYYFDKTGSVVFLSHTKQ